MATDGKFYKVFVASPGGLADERKAFRDALSEYNDCDAVHRSAVFLPVGWELTLPGVGRPQALINEDIETCDFFVLLLWDRWGSPTEPGINPSFSSGIEEEYNVALKCFEDYRKPMRQIVVLFKSVEERQLSDPGTQLGKVMEFKKMLEDEKRLLFDTFDNLESLKQKLRRSLSGWIRDHEKGAFGKIIESKVPPTTLPLSERADTGSFDLPDVIGPASRLEIEREGELAEKASTGKPDAQIRYAEFLRLRGRGSQASVLLEKVLKQEIGQMERARALRELARISLRDGDFAKSKRLCLESMQVVENHRGEGLSIAVTLVDLARACMLEGDFGGAELNLNKALLLREEQAKHGASVGRVAFALENLAGVLLEETKFLEAKPFAERSIILREHFAKDSNLVGGAKILLGRIESDLGNYGAAERLFMETLTGWTDAGLVSELPTVTVPLGVLRRRQGKFEEAQELVQGALITSERANGPEAPSVAGVLSALGGILRMLKAYRDSEVAIRRGLLIRERFVGQNHPRFAQSLSALGKLYFDQDAIAEAEDLFERARDIFRSAFGENAVRVAVCEIDLGRVYLRTDQFQKAERAFRGGIATMERQFTTAHPAVIRALRLQATALRALGRVNDASAAEHIATEGETRMDPTGVIEW